jgi:DNA processing protein
VLDRDELGAWLRLLETPGVGRGSARRLLAAFGSPEAALTASPEARREVVGQAAADALTGPSEAIDALLANTVAWLASASDAPRDVVTLADSRYPRLLLESADPPVLLYAEGRTELLAADAIAIVGSRNPTAQGVENARAFGAHLSRAGHTIVSGMALGIDAAAHVGGLEGSASTIAVAGTGLDQVYPSRNRTLAARIVAHGLIVSEFSLGTPPLPPNFLLRNRIIAGLARGTLVVEAALRSGSLSTARLAAESGRDVFAIPGSIHSPLARGCHALIKQGAKLVESAADILDELRPAPADAAPAAQEAVPARDIVLEALGFDPVSLDALVARTGWPPGELNIKLLELELDGRVARLPGQLFQRLLRA